MNAIKKVDFELLGLGTGLVFGAMSFACLVIDFIYCTQKLVG
jgi:hypothetical protein